MSPFCQIEMSPVLAENPVRPRLSALGVLRGEPVIVMQPVEHWERDDFLLWVFFPLWSSALRNPLVDSLMRSTLIEELHTLRVLDNPIQMAFPQN